MGRAGRRCALAAAGEGADQPAEHECRGPAARGEPAGGAGAPLDASEPRQAGRAEQRGDEEVQAQAEDVMGGVGAQELLDDAETRVAGDVQREQPGRPDRAAMAEPDQGAGKREVPDQLVQERRVKRGDVFVAAGTVRGIYPKTQGRLVGPPKSSWLK